MPSADKAFLVDSTKLERGEVWGETDEAVHWKGAFAVYGGHGATASSVIVYEIEPGKRVVFGWGWDGQADFPADTSTVTITLTPTEGGTELSLSHTGFLSEEQAAYIGVPVNGPYKPDHYRY